MSPIRFCYRTETHCFVHYDGRIEEWTVLVPWSRPPMQIGSERIEPGAVWKGQ
jgi:hypothetical protein